MHAYAKPFTAQSDIALLSEEGVLPRNIHLKTFEPHRYAAEFTCRHQAVNATAPTMAAQEMHELAMALTSGDRWANERDWPRAMKLWGQAKSLGHWKAALMWLQIARAGAGVNGARGQFRVEPQPPETVVAGTETLMRQGIADAFFWMGEFHGSGYGVDFSVDREWAFYELAADLGSPLAQTKIADVIGLGQRDMEKANVAEWANRPLMLKLLECAHAQGHGRASYELGVRMNTETKANRIHAPSTTPEEQFARTLQILHDGVRFGSQDAAGYLFATFDDGDPLVKRIIDPFRARRYKTLADALWHNPDLRFPNLDRVLPLPPSKLPQWDGKPDSLIDAAKGVRIIPRPPLTSAHQLPPEHRAHIPPDHELRTEPASLHDAGAPISGYVYRGSVGPDEPWGLAHARVAGYWQARLNPPSPDDRPHPETTRLREEFANLPPMRFSQDQPMRLDIANSPFAHEDKTHNLVSWHFVGHPVRAWAPKDWSAQAGVVRAIVASTPMGCTGEETCPATGIWHPRVIDREHPLSRVLGTAALNEGWKWQAFVHKGQPMPSLNAMGMPVKDAQVNWRLLLACEAGFEV